MQRQIIEKSTIEQLIIILQGYNGYNYEVIMQGVKTRIELSDDMLKEVDNNDRKQ